MYSLTFHVLLLLLFNVELRNYGNGKEVPKSSHGKTFIFISVWSKKNFFLRFFVFVAEDYQIQASAEGVERLESAINGVERRAMSCEVIVDELSRLRRVRARTLLSQ